MDYEDIAIGTWIEIDRLTPSGPVGRPRYGQVARKYYTGPAANQNWFGWLVKDIHGDTFIASPFEVRLLTDKERFALLLKDKL